MWWLTCAIPAGKPQRQPEIFLFQNHAFESWLEACWTHSTKYFITIPKAACKPLSSYSKPSTETLISISLEYWNKQTPICDILVPEQVSGEWNARMNAWEINSC